MHVESHDFRGWSPPDEPWNSGGGRIDVFASQKRRWLSFNLRPNCDFDRRPIRAAHVGTRLYIDSWCANTSIFRGPNRNLRCWHSQVANTNAKKTGAFSV